VAKEKDQSKEKQTESTYPREELVQNAQAIFNVMPEIVDGALHENKKNNLAKSEVNVEIKKFLNRKV
jgi:hypothetical protein